MRNVAAALAMFITLFGTVGHASQPSTLEKVKTGILPSGGFYSLYEVACRDQTTAAVASLEGKRRWCSLQNGSMSCYSSRQDASLNACGTNALAATETVVEDASTFQ